MKQKSYDTFSSALKERIFNEETIYDNKTNLFYNIKRRSISSPKSNDTKLSRVYKKLSANKSLIPIAFLLILSILLFFHTNIQGYLLENFDDTFKCTGSCNAELFEDLCITEPTLAFNVYNNCCCSIGLK